MNILQRLAGVGQILCLILIITLVIPYSASSLMMRPVEAYSTISSSWNYQFSDLPTINLNIRNSGDTSVTNMYVWVAWDATWDDGPNKVWSQQKVGPFLLKANSVKTITFSLPMPPMGKHNRFVVKYWGDNLRASEHDDTQWHFRNTDGTFQNVSGGNNGPSFMQSSGTTPLNNSPTPASGDLTGHWKGHVDWTDHFDYYPAPVDCKFSGDFSLGLKQDGNKLTGALGYSNYKLTYSNNQQACFIGFHGPCCFIENGVVSSSSFSGAMTGTTLKGSFTSNTISGSLDGTGTHTYHVTFKGSRVDHIPYCLGC